MRKAFLHIGLLTGIALLLVCGSCAPSADDDPLGLFARTVILATEHLDPPEVTLSTAYRFRPAAPLETGDLSAGTVTGFALIVATASPETLRVRLVPRGSLEPHTLVRVEPPPSDPWSGSAFQADILPATARQQLQAGKGIFWVDPTASGSASLQRRVGVVLPDALRVAFSRLDVYSLVAPDGTALGAGTIRLAEQFFYMTVLGDSIMWGNGLFERDKISSRVAEVIERQTGRRVIRQVMAVSGAKIVPGDNDGVCGIDCFRGSPYVATSLQLQLQIVERPERSDLVLVSGCINDVGVSAILSPATTAEELAERTAQFCGTEMADFLDQVLAAFPQTPVVVTGYYPIVSDASGLDDLLIWLRAQGVDQPEDVSELVAAMAANAQLFDAVARDSLQWAVDAANAADPPGWVAFADPRFGDAHSMFAPESRLWGLRDRTTHESIAEIPFEWVPDDPMFPGRLQTCIDRIGTGPTVQCLYSSLGHPNRQGARAYTDAVIEALEALGVWEVSP